MKRARRYLIAVETHPIQYKAPLFRYLARTASFDLKVLYAMEPDPATQGAGFGVPFVWDQPLREGYENEVLENVAREPSVMRFSGCDTPGLYAMLARERPDAVLVNGWVVKTCLQALWACRRLGIPCMVRGEANLLRERSAWKAVLQRVLVRQYDACLYIGSENRVFYEQRGVRLQDLFYAPYAVDHEAFSVEAANRAQHRDEIRTRWMIPADSGVALFAGKLEEKKRPLDLVEAAARLPDGQRKQITLLFAGDGVMRNRIAERARATGVRAIMAGFMNQREIPDAYAACDLLALPSDAGETWGLVVNEAMASGRPALVSRSAGCSTDLIREGVTGAAFDCGDVDTLASLMSKWVLDRPKCERAGRAAQQLVSGMGFDAIRRGLEDALDAVAPRVG